MKNMACCSYVQCSDAKDCLKRLWPKYRQRCHIMKSQPVIFETNEGGGNMNNTKLCSASYTSHSKCSILVILEETLQFFP